MTGVEQPPPGVPGPVIPLPGRTTHVEIGDITGGPIDPYEWHQATPALKNLFIQAWIAKACAAEKVDPNIWGPPYQTLVAHESGGYTGGIADPNIVNLYDTNAKAGIPSMGIAQVVQPNAPGENLLDPVVNIRASIRHVKEAFSNGKNPPGSLGKNVPPELAITNVQQGDPTKPPSGYQQGGQVTDPGIYAQPTGPRRQTDLPGLHWEDDKPVVPAGRRFGKGGALFDDEGPEFYAAAYRHNAPFAKAPPYRTRLNRQQEGAFRKWAADNHVQFDPNEDPSDYDMRGFWLSGTPIGAEPGGGQGFDDRWKTPYDTTFSRESMYATADCPFVWQDDQLVDMRDGSLVFSRLPSPQPLIPPDVGGRAAGGPVDMSGYGKRWHLEIQRANGSREQLPLTFKSAGGGVRNWDAGRVGLRPGDEIQLVKHRR